MNAIDLMAKFSILFGKENKEGVSDKIALTEQDATAMSELNFSKHVVSNPLGNGLLEWKLINQKYDIDEFIQDIVYISQVMLASGSSGETVAKFVYFVADRPVVAMSALTQINLGVQVFESKINESEL